MSIPVEPATPAAYLRVPLAEAEAHRKTVADLRADNLRLCAKAAEVHALRAQVRWSEIHAEELASLRKVVGACVGVLRNAGLLVDGFDWRHLDQIFAGLVEDLGTARDLVGETESEGLGPRVMDLPATGSPHGCTSAGCVVVTGSPAGGAR